MTEIDLYQPAAAPAVLTAAPALLEIDSWTAVASQVIRLAKEIADTPFVPDGLRGSVPATAAAILAGRELGLGPMTSLANVHVIKGKPALSAALMRALILAQGHQLETVDISDSRVVVRGRRKGEAIWEEASFTADQAKRAHIDLGGYPQDKLYARATSRLARRKFADVIAGMPYSAEELEDGEPEGEAPAAPAAIEPPKPPATRTARRQSAKVPADHPSAAPSATASEGATPDRPAPAPATTARSEPEQPPLPGEDDEPAPGSDRHRRIVGVVQGHMHRLGFAVDDGDRDERLPILAKLAGLRFDAEAVFSTSDFDEDELKVVADTLARCKDRRALDALLTAGEADE